MKDDENNNFWWEYGFLTGACMDGENWKDKEEKFSKDMGSIWWSF
jgi:hypothetical protein